MKKRILDRIEFLVYLNVTMAIFSLIGLMWVENVVAAKLFGTFSILAVSLLIAGNCVEECMPNED